jgi:hypothetical protein
LSGISTFLFEVRSCPVGSVKPDAIPPLLSPAQSVIDYFRPSAALTQRAVWLKLNIVVRAFAPLAEK